MGRFALIGGERRRPKRRFPTCSTRPSRRAGRCRGRRRDGSPSSLTPPCSIRRRASLRLRPKASAISAGMWTSPAVLARYGVSSTSLMSSGRLAWTKRRSKRSSAASRRPASWKRSTIRRARARFASLGRPVRRRLAEQQPVVLGHRLVGDAHQLPEHLLRRVGDADVVAQRLAHLPDAVDADQDRHRQDRLRRLAVGRLDVAAEQQVELLVGAAQLDVGLDRHRVVALQQRVEQLERRDRRVRFQPLLEVVALEQPRHRGLGEQPEQRLRPMSSHSLLKRTSVRSRSSTLKACSW